MNHYKIITAEQFRKNAFELIGKDWMLITAGNEEKANTMTASWGGLGVMYGKNVAFVVIRPQRYTKEFIDRESTFSLCFFDKDYRKTLNYLGTVSGRTENKIEKSGLTLAYYNGTPYFDEANYALICKKLFKQPLNLEGLLDERLVKTWYPNGDIHTLYIAEITEILRIKHNPVL